MLLNEDIQTLLYWGIEGEDYYVDANGRYRRTPEQKANFDNPDWRLANAGWDLANQFPKIQGRYSNGNIAFASNTRCTSCHIGVKGVARMQTADQAAEQQEHK